MSSASDSRAAPPFTAGDAPRDPERELAALRLRLAEAESEVRRLSALVAAAPVALVALAPDGTVQEWNRQAEQLFGWERAEVLGKPPPAPPLPRPPGAATRPPILPAALEMTYRRRRDGQLLVLGESAAPCGEDGGRVVALRDITRMISGMREVGERLRRSDERFGLMAEHAPDALVRFGLEPHGHFEFVSPAVRLLSGHEPQEWLADPELPARLCHPEDRPERERFHREVHERPTSGIWRWVRPDGSVIWTEHRGWPVRDGAGRTVALDGFVRDMTEHVLAQARLRDSDATHRAVLDAAADAIVAIDDEGIVRSFNRGAERVFGFPAAEVLGECVTRLIPPDERPLFFATLGECRAGTLAGEVLRREVGGLRGDGSVVPLELSLAEAHTAQGRVFVGIARDLTARRQAEAERAESERLATSTIDALAARVAIIDADGRVLRANHACSSFLEARGVGQVVGLSYLEVLQRRGALGDASSRHFVEALGEVLDGRRASAELETHFDDGPTRRWYTTRITRFPDPGPRRAVVAHEEITALKQAQARLELLSNVVERTDDAVVITDAEGCIEYVNAAFTRLLGYALSEVQGRPLRAFGERAALTSEDPAGRLVRARTRAGASVQLETAKMQLRGPDGALTHTAYTARDVTARSEAEAQRKQSEERVRRLLEMSTDVVSILGLDAVVRYQSPAAVRILGRSSSEAVDRSAFAEVHPEDQARLFAAFAQLSGEPGGVASAVFRLRHGDGGWRMVETVARNLAHEPLVGGIILNTRDITEQHRAEEALRRSEQSFRVLIERLPDAVCVHRGGRIVYTNPAGERLLRRTMAEMMGTLVLDHLAPEEHALTLERLRQAVALGQPQPPRETVFVDSRGERFSAEVVSLPVDFDGAPAVVSVIRDVTERKRLQARLLLADRMVSVGTLAAGVAHEINNPLAFTAVNLGWAKDEVARWRSEAGDGPWAVAPRALAALAEALKEAQDGCQRVRGIVRDLKTFSRADEETRGPVDLRRVVERAVVLAGNELRHRAQLVKAFHEVPPIVGNEARLGQVFINLLVNAAQAMPEGAAERHEIRLAVRPDGEGHVAVEVQDTGSGIPADVLPRIFDPFFTTKPVGEGTGLGLSICHSIVTDHGGTIQAQSEPGKGTLFRVRLPLGQQRTTAASGAAPERGRAPGGRLLIVDDEAQLGKALGRVLGEEHQVTQESDARRALGRLAGGETFDLVLCDLMMPHMSGMELYAAVERQAPAMAERFVFVTGGAFSAASRAFLDRVPNARLEKPFDPEDVRRLLRARVRS